MQFRPQPEVVAEFQQLCRGPGVHFAPDLICHVTPHVDLGKMASCGLNWALHSFCLPRAIGNSDGHQTLSVRTTGLMGFAGF